MDLEVVEKPLMNLNLRHFDCFLLTLRSIPSILSVWLGPVSPEMTPIKRGTNLRASSTTVPTRPSSCLAAGLRSDESSSSILLLMSDTDPNFLEYSSAEYDLSWGRVKPWRMQALSTSVAYTEDTSLLFMIIYEFVSLKMLLMMIIKKTVPFTDH